MRHDFTDPRFIVTHLIILLTAALDLAVIWLLVSRTGLPADVIAFLGVVLGVWHAALVGAYSYWLGTTHSSQAKDETIAALAKTERPPP